MRVCVCVCACMRACVRACVCEIQYNKRLQQKTFANHIKPIYHGKSFTSACVLPTRSKQFQLFTNSTFTVSSNS